MQQALRVAVDDVQEAALLVGEVAALLEHELEVAANRGQGRP
jgi:hypothetical protein